MIFPGLQLLEEPKPGKPLQTRGTRAPPTGETAQGAKVRLGRFPSPSLVLNKTTHKAQPGYRNMVYADFCYSTVP